VLVPAGMDEPVSLIKALASRGFETDVVRDEPSVMLGLSASSGDAPVLIVVEPQCWSRLDELVHAVRVYYDAVRCWQYSRAEHAAGRLSSLEIELGGESTGGGSGAAGQILNRHRSVEDLLVKLPEGPMSAHEVVTQQELTMLLGPVPGEAG